MNYQKIKAYVGFAIKSKQIKFGLDDVLKLNKIGIIIFSESLKNSSRDKLNLFIQKNQIANLQLTDLQFAEIFGEKNIKVAAILNLDLAEAIKKEID